MEQYFTYNGEFITAGTPVLTSSGRVFRFGESLFETVRMNKGELMLFDFHLDRLYKGMNMLGIEITSSFNRQALQTAILELAKKNGVLESGRVRLTVFRKEGGLYDPIPGSPEWTIECSQLADDYLGLNEIGYAIDISSNNQKGSGPLSNLKTGNYIIYILAAQLAKEKKVNECLVLNSHNRIADSSIFNLFLIRNGILYTPALSEGPVDGVMRRHIIKQFRDAGNPVQEVPVTIADLETADEVFLTNALYGIRWVKSFRSIEYSNNMTIRIYSELFQQNTQRVV